MPRPLEALLTLGATALVLVFFASVPHWPREWTARSSPNPFAVVPPLLRAPSVLAAAAPAPALNLELPTDMAVLVRRTGINGETGLIPTAGSIATYRLRASGDLVSVGAPTGLDPVTPVPGDPDPAFRVRGVYALAKVDRGVTTLHWTERGVTYEISSRTLDPNRLAEVAAKLR